MYNIKIKSLPDSAKTGDQLNYSLVDRNSFYLKPSSQNEFVDDVKDTMSAVPKEEANVEAEGGETVVGDINNDGFVEHQRILGKRHSEGGVPLNIPPGAFIFSDTKKMTIKDPEVLKMFNMSERKKGYTPAEIAKKYDINNYIAVLKDKDRDTYEKNTAEVMLAKNMEKLGMLALVQESIKGFPDGIPAIAESAVAGFSGDQKMQFGGSLRKLQGGGFNAPRELNGIDEPDKRKAQTSASHSNITEGGNPEVGFTFYKGLVPVTVSKVDSKFAIDNGADAAYIKLSDGTRLNKQEFDTLRKKGSMKPAGFNKSSDIYSVKPLVYKNTIKDSDGNSVKLDLYSGDYFNYNGVDYQVLDPQAGSSNAYKGSGKAVRDTFDNTQGVVHVSYMGADGKLKNKFIEGEDIGDAYKFDKSLVKVNPNTFWRSKYDNSIKNQLAKYTTAKSATAATNAASIAPVKKTTSEVLQTPTAPFNPNLKVIPATEEVQSNVPFTKQDSITMFKRQEGGELPMAQFGGIEKREPKVVKSEKISLSNGTATKITYDTGEIEVVQNGKVSAYDAPDPTKFQASAAYKKGNWTESAAEVRRIYSDPKNDKLRTKLHERFSQLYPDLANTMTPEQSTALFLRGQEDVAKIQNAYSGSDFLKSDNWDRTGKFKSGANTVYKSVAKKLGIGELSPEDIKKYQGLYQAGQDIVDSPEFSGLFSNFDIKPVGVVDQTRTVNGVTRAISPVDNIWGNTTTGQGFRLKENLDRGKAPEKPDAVAPDIEAPTRPAQEQVNNKGGWWLQDRTNFYGALTDNIHKYDPAMANFDFAIPGYVLEDPSRKLAANQEQMNTMGEFVTNTQSGQNALATMLGISGKGFENAANVISEVDNRNVNTVNNASANSANIKNQEEQLNEGAKQKYVSEMATSNQQYDNARNQIKWRQIGAYNNGVTNLMRKKQQEQVLTPQVYIDPITGDVKWSGKSRDMFGVDTYHPPYNSSDNFDIDSEYKRLTEEQGMSPDNAVKLLRVKSIYKAKQNKNPYLSGLGASSYGAVSPYDFDEE